MATRPDRDSILAGFVDATNRRQNALGRIAPQESSAIDLAVTALTLDVQQEELADCLRALAALKRCAAEDDDAVLLGDFSPPELPEDYQIEAEIGRGGVGVVYRARQISLERTVAVKVLRHGGFLHAEGLRRFQREARNLAKLRHPHIVSIHHVGNSAGRVYFTMDLIEGRSLAHILDAGPMKIARALRVMHQIASAIAYSHSRGVVHRDLKPSNVLLDELGNAYVVDFGLALDLSIERDLTQTGHILGTPAYMSPEQARGDTSSVGESSDIYSLGALFYHLLTGSHPFQGRTLTDLMHAVVHENPPSPRKLNPRIPRDAGLICCKAMEKVRRRRYLSAEALLLDIKRLEKGRTIHARAATLRYRAVRWIARHLIAVITGGSAAVAAAILVFLVLQPRFGQSLADIVRDAKMLEEAGEYRSAMLLLEEPLSQTSWDPRLVRARNTPTLEVRLFEPLAERALLALERCRVEHSVELIRAGRRKEAQPFLDAVVATIKIPKSGVNPILSLPGRRHNLALPQANIDAWVATHEFVWQLIRARALRGDVVEAWQIFRAIQSSRFKEQRDYPLDAGVLYDWRQRLMPALIDSQHPNHRFASLALVSSFATEFERQAWMSKWLEPRTHLSSGCLLAALVIGMDEHTIRSREERALNQEQGLPSPAMFASGVSIWAPNFDETLGLLARPSCVPAMAKLTQDQDLTSAARSLAFAFLWAAADLPIAGHPEGFRASVSRGKETLELGLGLWEEIRGLPREETYRRRVELMIESLTDPPDGMAGQGLKRKHAWLRRRTGADPIPGIAFKDGWWPSTDRDLPGAWAEWWAQHGNESPRRWLARALGLEKRPGEEDFVQIYSKLRQSEDYWHVAWLHYLLTLSIPAEIEGPAWVTPFLPCGVPDWLIEGWRATLATQLDEAPYVLRVALIELHGIDGSAPKVVTSVTRGVRLGERIRPASASDGKDVALDFDYLVQQAAGHAELVDKRAGYSGFVASRGTQSIPTDVVLVGPGGTREHITLACLSLPGSPTESWDIERWREAVADGINWLRTFLSTHDTPSGQEGALARWKDPFARGISRLDVETAVFGACALPCPAASDSLRWLDEYAARHSMDYRRHLLRGVPFARLLAGDESALDFERTGFRVLSEPAAWDADDWIEASDFRASFGRILGLRSLWSRILVEQEGGGPSRISLCSRLRTASAFAPRARSRRFGIPSRAVRSLSPTGSSSSGMPCGCE